MMSTFFQLVVVSVVVVVVIVVVVCVGLSAICSLDVSEQFVDNDGDIAAASSSSDTRPLATS